MMDDRTGVKAVRVCGAIFFTLLLVLFLSVEFEFYYDLNDDTMIKDILSGAYTGSPSGFCIQMLYPLGWCIALFYKAIPTIPWYGLFLCLCQFGVFYLIALRLLSIMQSTRAKMMALTAEAVLVLGLFLREFVIIQYSVTAGICMTGAVFLFITTPKTDKPSVFFRKNLLPLLLVVLAFLIRTRVCVMLLPFLLLAGLAKWFCEEKIFTSANFKKYIMLIVTALLCMAAVYSLDMLAYKGTEWSSFRGFFDARTKLYDFYGLPPYENNREFYDSIGLSRESYTLLENYNFALDDSIDTWRLEAIVSYQEEMAGQHVDVGTGLEDTFGFVSKNSVGEAVWLYKNQLFEDLQAIGALVSGRTAQLPEDFSSRSVISIAVIAAYVIYFCVCLLPAEGKLRLAAGLKMAGILTVRCVIWLYLYMVNRLPDRITIPLLMMELVVIAGFGICDMVPKQRVKTAFRAARSLFYILCIVTALIAFNGNLQSVESEYRNRAEADARWNAMMDYCRKNGNNYYIIDVYSSTSYQGAPYSEKIFSGKGIFVDNTYKNFDVCGGWAAKSPLTRQKLSRKGLKDIQGALCGTKTDNRTKTYFIADADKELGWLIQYYEKRRITIEPKRVDQIRTPSSAIAFDVYELKRKGV
ncbi:MAG: hypothetical protein K2N73_09835 [Lachnospiraceae bacterium]|nr:hypothetical protein [Lachnospiraceae bacterium]